MTAHSWLSQPLRQLRRHWRQRGRQRLARRLSDQSHPLAEFYRNLSSATSAPEGQYLALDMETTGLKPGRHRILSLGWVQIDHGIIRLDSARHLLIRPEQPLEPANAAIHGITDQMAATGCSLEEGLTALLPDLAGRVLIGHHVRFEQTFLDRACRQLWRAPLKVPTIDTLALGMRDFERRGRTPAQGELTLGALRTSFGLPRYQAHHALSDALATAELFLAFQVRLGWNERQLRALTD